jgi:hypothetical protein
MGWHMGSRETQCVSVLRSPPDAGLFRTQSDIVFFQRVQVALQKHNLCVADPRATPHPLLLPPCTGDDDADCVPLHKYEWCQVISPF